MCFSLDFPGECAWLFPPLKTWEYIFDITMPANHPAEEPGSPYSPTSDVESLPEVQDDPEISLYPLQRLDEENARAGIISQYVNAELPTPQEPLLTPPEPPTPPYP